MQTAHIQPFSSQQTISNHDRVSQTPHTKREYATTSKALDSGAGAVSPAIARTYRVLTDMDFADRSTRLCKGYIWHATATIAHCIGCSQRTIQRHLVALEQVGLIIRQRRGHASTLVRLQVLSSTKALPTVDNHDPQTTKMSFRYKGTKETIRINNTNKQRSLEALRRYEARFDDVVTHLIALGYNAQQAVNDFLTYGKEELRQQIDNLYTYVRTGKTFGSYAKWLNWAIRAKHRVDATQIHETTRHVSSTHTSSRVDQEYELVIDAQGYTTYQPKQEPEEGSNSFLPAAEDMDKLTLKKAQPVTPAAVNEFHRDNPAQDEGEPEKPGMRITGIWCEENIFTETRTNRIARGGRLSHLPTPPHFSTIAALWTEWSVCVTMSKQTSWHNLKRTLLMSLLQSADCTRDSHPTLTPCTFGSLLPIRATAAKSTTTA